MHSITRLIRIAIPILCLVSAATAPGSALSELAREQFTFAAQQYAGLLQRLEEEKERVPRTFENGTLTTVRATDWTSGFFAGSLWLVFEHTRDPVMRASAEDFTRRVETIQHFTGHHDVGFMLGCSYGEAWRVTGDQAYRAVLIRGARSLATRYHASTGLVRSWDSKRWSYPVIIDNMMNLGILWFAHVETGELAFRDIVISHADKTLANHFRPDASSYHVVDYDSATGMPLKQETFQGFANGSAWARGQAWALAGYAAAARFSNTPAYLAHARKIADFILRHPRLPADGIPYWDFDAPDIPTALRDASAGAVMAVGLLNLADQLGAEEGGLYRELGERQLRSLCSRAYRAGLDENGSFLLMHSVGHMPHKKELDVPLCYADYYFLKGLSHVLGAPFAASGVP